VTYTVEVHNAGPDAAQSVTVLTKIKAGKFVSAGGATCATVKGKLSCALGDMASGTTKSFTLVVSAGHRPIDTTSTVSSTTSDPNSANNTDSESTAIA
jgi:hypothetical protein